MSTLAPKMSDQISYERPVGAAPSILESVLGVATELGSDYLNAKAKASSGGSASDRKNEALSGYVAALDEIASSDLSQTDKQRRIERLRRDQLIATPAYREDIASISGDEFGFDQGEGDVGRGMEDQFSKWLEGPKGVAAAATYLLPGSSQGKVGEQGQREILYAEFLKDNAQEAAVLSLADSKANDEIKWRKLAPRWSEEAVAEAAGMAVNASTNTELLANPTQALDILDDAIRARTDFIRSQATAAGIGVSFIDAQIESVVKPLKNLREMYQSEMANPGRMLEAVTKANELDVVNELVTALGPIGADPTFREIAYNYFINNGTTGDKISTVLQTITEARESGDYSSFNLGVDTMPGVSSAVATETSVVSPTKIDEWRRKSQDNPDFIPSRIAMAATALGSNVEGEAGTQGVHAALQQVALASEAYEGPIGEATLRVIFSPKNLENIAKLGEEGEVLLSRILIQQVKNNRAMVANSSEIMSETRVRSENGRFIAERKGKGSPLGWFPIKSGPLKDRTESVNYLLSIGNRFPAVGKKVSNATNYLYRGVEPTEDQVDGDDDFPDLENVTHVSFQAPNALVGLIDSTEGGGEYDTLFGFSQREGGRFSNVRIDQMTIGEVLEFSSPSGAYGQWVKGEVGRVATPMGRYQYVGTTLRAISQEMGLSADTVFNKQTQDAIFDFHVRKLIRGQDDISAAKTLKGTWEGFKSKSDGEIANAVAMFRGTPNRDYSNLPTTGATGLANTFSGGGDRPKARSSAFASSDFLLSSVDTPDARFLNPGVDSQARDIVDTEDQRRGSRMSVGEARRQVVASLKAAGYGDKEVEEVMKNG